MYRATLQLAVCSIALLALNACLPGSAALDDDGGPPAGNDGGSTLHFGLGFIPNPVQTGPEGDNQGAFVTGGVGFAELGHKLGGATLPMTADLSQWNPPIGNQGNLGSCCNWSVNYSLGGWYANKMGLNRTQFSPMYIYSQWEKQSSCSDKEECGAWPGSLAPIISSSGIEPVIDYDPVMAPFSIVNGMPKDEGAQMPPTNVDDASGNNYLDQPNMLAASFAKPYGMTGFSHRNVAPSNMQLANTDPSGVCGGGFCPGYPGTSTFIKQQIANGVPVLVGVSIWPEFDNYNGGAAVTPPTAMEIAQQKAYDAKAAAGDAGYHVPDGGVQPPANTLCRGLHEIMCDKYDANGLWCQNQWGAGAGSGGWWQLSWAYVDACILEEDSAVMTITPAPSKPTIVMPVPVDGGTPVDCTGFNVQVNTLLGVVQINTLTLYANGNQIAQQPGDAGMRVTTLTDAGTDGGDDGYYSDFSFTIVLDGGSVDGGYDLKAVALDDAGLSGTSPIVRVVCQGLADAGPQDAGTDGGPACNMSGTVCSSASDCCFKTDACQMIGNAKVCCASKGSKPDMGDLNSCCNAMGVDHSGNCL